MTNYLYIRTRPFRTDGTMPCALSSGPSDTEHHSTCEEVVSTDLTYPGISSTNHAPWHLPHFLSSTLGVPHHEHRRTLAASGCAAAPSPHLHFNTPPAVLKPSPFPRGGLVCFSPGRSHGFSAASCSHRSAMSESMRFTTARHSSTPRWYTSKNNSSPARWRARCRSASTYPRHASRELARSHSCRSSWKVGRGFTCLQ